MVLKWYLLWYLPYNTLKAAYYRNFLGSITLQKASLRSKTEMELAP